MLGPLSSVPSHYIRLVDLVSLGKSGSSETFRFKLSPIRPSVCRADRGIKGRDFVVPDFFISIQGIIILFGMVEYKN